VSVCWIERDRGRRAVAGTPPANGRRRIDDSLAVVKFTMSSPAFVEKPTQAGSGPIILNRCLILTRESAASAPRRESRH
jgi:hypothetical protein